MERTKLMWTPRERCTPEQDRQMKIPSGIEHHCGAGTAAGQTRLGDTAHAPSQSAQVELAPCFIRSRSTPVYCAILAKF